MPTFNSLMDELLAGGAFSVCEAHFRAKIAGYRAQPDFAERIAQHFVMQYIASVEAGACFNGKPLVVGELGGRDWVSQAL